MLLAALGATIIGFVLLIVALVTANWWFAIACVVVSVVGVLLLLGDVLTYHRGDRDADLAEDERDDDGAPVEAAAAADSDAADTDTDAADTDAADTDAAREAGTVGHEEFGHHEEPATATGGDTDATAQFPLAGLGTGNDWSHESSADTDRDTDQPAGDDRATGLIFPGRYDPDMTDQIPQIEIERAWGTEWEPPEDPDKK